MTAKKGTKWVKPYTGSTLDELSFALRRAGMSQESVLTLVARGAKWGARTDIQLTGEALTERDVLDIARCRVVEL